MSVTFFGIEIMRATGKCRTTYEPVRITHAKSNSTITKVLRFLKSG